MVAFSFTQPDIKLVLDVAGIIHQASVANDMAEESVEGWLGLHWADTVVGAESERVAGLVDRAMAQGDSAYLQITQRFPSGLAVPVEYMTVRLHDPERVLAIGRDVRAVAQLQSRLAAAQQAMERGYWKLREVETRYRALFEASTDAMLVIRGGDFRILEANPAAIVALGLATGRPEEVADRDFLADVALADRPVAKTALLRARERGQAPRILLRFGSSEQSWLVRLSALVSDQGPFLLAQLLPASDPNSPAVVPSEVSIADLVARLPDGFAVLDEDGHILQANPPFLDLVQVGALGGVVGEHLGKWLGRPGGDVAMLLESLRSNGSVRLFPSTITGEFGTRTEVELSALLNDDAKPAYIGVLVRDVSRRLQPSGQSARLGGLLSSMTEQLGRTRLKTLVNSTVGLVERHYIEAALELTNGNRTAAARLLGLSRQSLYKKLERYGIKAQDDDALDKTA